MDDSELLDALCGAEVDVDEGLDLLAEVCVDVVALLLLGVSLGCVVVVIVVVRGRRRRGRGALCGLCGAHACLQLLLVNDKEGCEEHLVVANDHGVLDARDLAEEGLDGDGGEGLAARGDVHDALALSDAEEVCSVLEVATLAGEDVVALCVTVLLGELIVVKVAHEDVVALDSNLALNSLDFYVVVEGDAVRIGAPVLGVRDGGDACGLRDAEHWEDVDAVAAEVVERLLLEVAVYGAVACAVEAEVLADLAKDDLAGKAVALGLVEALLIAAGAGAALLLCPVAERECHAAAGLNELVGAVLELLPDAGRGKEQ